MSCWMFRFTHAHQHTFTIKSQIFDVLTVQVDYTITYTYYCFNDACESFCPFFSLLFLLTVTSGSGRLRFFFCLMTAVRIRLGFFFFLFHILLFCFVWTVARLTSFTRMKNFVKRKKKTGNIFFCLSLEKKALTLTSFY